MHNSATVVLSIFLAFVFGYGLTMRGVLRAGVGFRTALSVALAADTVCISVMELLDNAVILAVPGAMNAGLASGLFWASLAFCPTVAFLLTTPVNRWVIARGEGHAVVHAYHHPGNHPGSHAGNHIGHGHAARATSAPVGSDAGDADVRRSAVNLKVSLGQALMRPSLQVANNPSAACGVPRVVTGNA